MKPYYDKAGITIYCGETLEIMVWLRILRLIFDAIIADLPYGTTACSWDTVIPFEPLWENYKGLVKGNGAVVLFGSQPFSSKLVMSNLEWFKYEWVWDKVSGGNIFNAKLMPMKTHEDILVFSNGKTSNGNKANMIYIPQKYTANDENIRPANKKGTKIGKSIYDNRKKQNKAKSKIDYNINERYPKSIIHLSKYTKETNSLTRLHPTQKPVALLAYLIRTYTNPGEIILDNTMGSGTTLVAAQNEGRQAVGIEISEDYCKIAVERLRQPSLFSIPDQAKAITSEQLAIDFSKK